MSKEIAEVETDDGALNLTQFNGGEGRGIMVQITGPGSSSSLDAQWLTLRPADAKWLATQLHKWVAAQSEAGEQPHVDESPLMVPAHECPACSGDGMGRGDEYHYHRCKKCGGSGLVHGKRLERLNR